MGSPALSRVDRSFEPGFPGGLLAAALGFPLHGGHAHHNRFRFPYFECWLKKLLSITHSAGDKPRYLCRFVSGVSLGSSVGMTPIPLLESCFSKFLVCYIEQRQDREVHRRYHPAFSLDRFRFFVDIVS